MFRIYEMVAGIKVAIMLQDECTSAGFCEDAQTGRCTQPGTQCQVENLNENPPDISKDPFIKNLSQKVPISFALY